MRISKEEKDIIKNTFLEVFQTGEIYLFGSRVDDNQKGGDIDLYIKLKKSRNTFYKKIQFLTLLEQKLGEQKIDIIIAKNEKSLIEKEAMKNGILL